MLVVVTTAANLSEAEALADRLVAERLAACVQVLPKMTSFYFWEGSVRREAEHLLLIKTLEEKADAVEAFIHENHSYSVPEFVALEAQRVSESYLAWMKEYLS
jgi:periplasmic divalent cation tolerance protein